MIGKMCLGAAILAAGLIAGPAMAQQPAVQAALTRAQWDQARNASLDMLGFLTDLRQLSRDDAYSLMSVAADFAVTQVVDGRQGIHVRMPRGIFPPRKLKS